MRYAKVQGHNVFLMDKVKTKEGYIAVQALRNGETAVVKRTSLKSISYKYPKKVK